MDQLEQDVAGIEIAVIGMAGRFPGADNVDALWRNICNGVEAVTPFSDELLREKGVPEAALRDPSYVKSGIVLEDMDRFDAGFFGLSPRDAEQLDPQHRLFLETAWQALEHAGHAGSNRSRLIGTYAGCGTNVYLLRHLLPTADLNADDVASLLGLITGNDKDSLATRVAYKLDLRGPALTVQTACSTSLVAVHLACRGLLNHEADMALAGGVWLNLLQEGGYRYQPGSILSPDGHCRAFDTQAAGTAIGSGSGAVLLKRLSDAIADRDTIHAVIKGSALNNDGSAKVGYTAPSIDGQAEVILAAQAMADVEPDSIGYVEAHGTGTALGDPIEMTALTKAFRAGTKRVGYCAVGSVKTNVGHLDAAAGVTGLIKAIMALKHRVLPPSLNFERPNPAIDFASSPFYVNTQLRPWPSEGMPRRAGVSSFGMGGTNVHVVLEEAPALQGAAAGHPGDVGGHELLVLSARSAPALDAAARQLTAHLREHPAQSLVDVAYTLRTGRRRFEHRAVVLAAHHNEASQALDRRDPASFVSGRVLSEAPTLAFLFPGQGAQHVGMGRALYDREPIFRRTVDRCCDLLMPRLGLDLRALIFAPAANEAAAAERLAQTAITQPALFVVAYAMAQLWMHRGLKPDAMLGHSIGEYVAACIAGVFSLEDALDIIASRGRLLQSMAPGAMLAVSLPEAALRAAPHDACDLAAVNAADLCVLSGTPLAVDAAERRLGERGVAVRRLHVSHAFHSMLVEPVLVEFRALLSRVRLSAPKIPFVSNVTGRWITPDEACSADYWVRHVRGTVRFAEGLDELLGKPDRILLEVGPGETLCGLARRHPRAGSVRPILASQCHPQRRGQNLGQFARCLARLWVAGIDVEPAAQLDAGRRRRVPLPTYPFERQSYWIAPPARGTAPQPALKARDVSDWLYAPAWRRTASLVARSPKAGPASGSVLMMGDAGGLADRLSERLQASSVPVVRVERGGGFEALGAQHYAVRCSERADFEELLRRVGPVAGICHLWSLDPVGTIPSQADGLERGFHSLVALAQALDATAPHGGRQGIALTVVVNQLEDVTGTEPLCAEKATLLGPCKVIPQEYPGVTCRVLDVLSPAGADDEARLARQIAAEMAAVDDKPLVAYRGGHRWVKTFEPLPSGGPVAERFRPAGVYLVTGGLGGVGLALARHLALKWQAKLVLMGRTSLPPRTEWPALAAADSTPAHLGAKLRGLLELEALGAEVWAVQADVADAARMRAVVAQARARFGAIHGVVHAAGEAGSGVIANMDRATTQKMFASKVFGTQSLMAALGGDPLDFVVFCSSLASLAGGLGKCDYTAANAYLDAVAADAARVHGRAVVSINWDGWREVGMAAGMRLPEHIGIGPGQGPEVFERIVNGPGTAQAVVSTTELAGRLEMERGSFLSIALPEVAEGIVGRNHPRPDLQTVYVAPEGELEDGLARIWRAAIGIASVGVNDNLFELGGDSLLAIQLLAKVRTAYGVELHPAVFFKNATIAALAVLVETRLIEEIEKSDPAAMAADREHSAV